MGPHGEERGNAARLEPYTERWMVRPRRKVRYTTGERPPSTLMAVPVMYDP
jgi:hypothetical protein